MQNKLLATGLVLVAALVALPASAGLAASNHPPHAERLSAAHHANVGLTRLTRVAALPSPNVLGYLRALYAASLAASTPPGGFTRDDGLAAVDQAFARFGPVVLACAHGVAERESHHSAYSDNGSRHGMYQLHDGFVGSLRAAAAGLQRAASWYDPYVNAWAASIGFTQAGNSFRRNWPTTVPAGCR